jgi:hypothetical protein
LLSVALLVLQVVLAGTFVAAASAKGLRADEFLAALRLSYLPEWTVRPLALLVPGLEVALAGWLLLAPPDRLVAPFAASAALLAAFTLWMGWVSGRRLRVRCGCFGGDGGEVGPRTLARNAILLLAALGGLALASRVASPLPGPSWEAAASVLALGLCVALVQALRLVWPNLVLSYERLRDGNAAAALDLE